MGYDERFYIKKKKGQGQDRYVIDEYGYISYNPREVISNFFGAIKFDPKQDFDDIWDDVWKDIPPKGDDTEYNWTKIDDGTIPIWTSHGPLCAGGLYLYTPEGIKAFLEANDFKDIVSEDIERISIGWDG